MRRPGLRGRASRSASTSARRSCRCADLLPPWPNPTGWWDSAASAATSASGPTRQCLRRSLSQRIAPRCQSQARRCGLWACSWPRWPPRAGVGIAHGYQTDRRGIYRQWRRRVPAAPSTTTVACEAGCAVMRRGGTPSTPSGPAATAATPNTSTCTDRAGRAT